MLSKKHSCFVPVTEKKERVPENGIQTNAFPPNGLKLEISTEEGLIQD